MPGSRPFNQIELPLFLILTCVWLPLTVVSSARSLWYSRRDLRCVANLWPWCGPMGKVIVKHVKLFSGEPGRSTSCNWIKQELPLSQIGLIPRQWIDGNCPANDPITTISAYTRYNWSVTWVCVCHVGCHVGQRLTVWLVPRFIPLSSLDKGRFAPGPDNNTIGIW